MYSKAADVLKNGLETYEEDLAQLKDVLQAAKGAPDLANRPILDPNNGERLESPQPEKLKVLLQERLASASVVLKPRRPGPVVRVAIHKGCGENGTKAFFETLKNVEVEVVDSLSLSLLDRFDCVFILQTSSINKEDYFHNLRRYVAEGGGGVVFQHDMCGRPRRGAFDAKTPFPEICLQAPGRKGKNDANARTLKAKVAHPALGKSKAGETYEHMYYDHLTLKPGAKGVVIVDDADGDPVVVTGEIGHGRVLFDGNVNLTVKDEDKPLTGFNAHLAKGAVEWFTGVVLEKK
jgi:hypothetical protein